MDALPSEDLSGAERRVAVRVRTLKRAKVFFNNRYSTYDCVVRNISATGALLTLGASVPLPRSFEIRIGDDREERPARLVYRRGVLAGIRFADLPDDEPLSDLPALPMLAYPAATREDGPVIEQIVAKPLPTALVRRFPWF